MINVSPQELCEMLSYDEATGELRWKKKGLGRRSERAGGLAAQGYIYICVRGKRILAHRAIWAIVYGEWPQSIVDHVNMDRTDNRLCNLRLATKSQNACNTRLYRNNTSGVKGVRWRQNAKKWTAEIRVNGRSKHLGTYDNKEDAAMAYAVAAQKLHGEFARAA